MHKVVIPQAVIDRVIRHRGKEHVYENLDPRRTALLVVDMQNAFMMPGVAHAYCQYAESIVPNVNRLAQRCARPARRSSGSRPPLASSR